MSSSGCGGPRGVGIRRRGRHPVLLRGGPVLDDDAAPEGVHGPDPQGPVAAAAGQHHGDHAGPEGDGHRRQQEVRRRPRRRQRIRYG